MWKWTKLIGSSTSKANLPIYFCSNWKAWVTIAIADGWFVNCFWPQTVIMCADNTRYVVTGSLYPYIWPLENRIQEEKNSKDKKYSKTPVRSFWKFQEDLTS
jgi:hypothetical protein